VTENLRQGALYAPNRHDSVCSADFRSDASACGRRFRTFNMVDDFKREALHIEIDAAALTRRHKAASTASFNRPPPKLAFARSSFRSL